MRASRRLAVLRWLPFRTSAPTVNYAGVGISGQALERQPRLNRLPEFENATHLCQYLAVGVLERPFVILESGLIGLKFVDSTLQRGYLILHTLEPRCARVSLVLREVLLSPEVSQRVGDIGFHAFLFLEITTNVSAKCSHSAQITLDLGNCRFRLSEVGISICSWLRNGTFHA